VGLVVRVRRACGPGLCDGRHRGPREADKAAGATLYASEEKQLAHEPKSYGHALEGVHPLGFGIHLLVACGGRGAQEKLLESALRTPGDGR
jgi:hypothetical protein